MKCNFQSAPTKPNIPYSGQFVDEDHDATFVMRHDQFWEGWMFSVFKKLLKGLIIVPLKPIAEWRNDYPDAPYYADVNYQIGETDIDDIFYPFVRNYLGGWDWVGRPMHMRNKAWKPGHADKDWEFVDQRCMMPHKNSDGTWILS